jgi:hypothetical protein
MFPNNYSPFVMLNNSRIIFAFGYSLFIRGKPISPRISFFFLFFLLACLQSIPRTTSLATSKGLSKVYRYEQLQLELSNGR